MKTGQTEVQLQRAVADLLRLLLPPTVWTCPNVEVRGGGDAARTGAIARSRGANSGWPDVLIVAADGRLIGVELKAGKGRQSDAQRLVEAAWLARGAEYHVCRSVDQVAAIVARVRH